MPLPRPIADRIRSPRFWTDYLGTTGPEHLEQKLVTFQIPLEVSDDARLDFGLDSWLTYCTLHLDGEWLGRDGGDEQFPPYPDALRCIEVEQLARAIAIRDPELVHPGPVVALLAKLSPITDDTEARHWLPTLAAAWRELDAGPVPAQRYRFWDHATVSAFDVRASKFRWIKRPRGFVLEQAAKRKPEVTVASLRVDGIARVFRPMDPVEAVEHYPELAGEQFPHAALERVLEAARQTCAAAVTRRDERIGALARQVAAGDRDARTVLGDALEDNAAPSLIRAARRGERWAAEVAAGVGPWELG